MDLSNGLEDVPVLIEGSSGVLTFPQFQVSSLFVSVVVATLGLCRCFSDTGHVFVAANVAWLFIFIGVLEEL